jgi:hypothetical protein
MIPRLFFNSPLVGIIPKSNILGAIFVSYHKNISQKLHDWSSAKEVSKFCSNGTTIDYEITILSRPAHSQ